MVTLPYQCAREALCSGAAVFSGTFARMVDWVEREKLDPTPNRGDRLMANTTVEEIAARCFSGTGPTRRSRALLASARCGVACHGRFHLPKLRSGWVSIPLNVRSSEGRQGRRQMILPGGASASWRGGPRSRLAIPFCGCFHDHDQWRSQSLSLAVELRRHLAPLRQAGGTCELCRRSKAVVTRAPRRGHHRHVPRPRW